ncbi:MAG: hypothetical protein ACKVPY_08735 [Paracoccaceae bacterium]
MTERKRAGSGDAADPAEEFEALVREIRAHGAEGLARLRAAAGGNWAEGDWAALEARLEAEVREHPLGALGVAALAGLALGLLIRR